MAKKQGESARDATLPGGLPLGGRKYAVPISGPAPQSPEVLPEPPAPEKIASLPLRAQLAFAARCVRRVHPLFRSTWPATPAEYLRAVDEAVGFAEVGGRRPADYGEAEAVSERAAAAHGAAPPDSAAAFVAAAVASAVVAVARAAKRDEEGMSPTSAVLVVIRGCVNAADAAGFRKEVVAGIRGDFGTLETKLSAGPWSGETPVPPDVFGALWPESPPNGWPAEAPHGTMAPVREKLPPSPDCLDDIRMSSDELLSAILREIDAVLQPTRERFEQVLGRLKGLNLESPEANQRLACLIQEAAGRLHLAFVCPKCPRPARFQWSAAGNSPAGSFSFVHTGATHGRTASIPELTTRPKGSHSAPAADSEKSE